MSISYLQAEQRRSLEARFDSRQATAARFIEAYVSEVFDREILLAVRTFAGPIIGDAFARTASDQGFDAAVLLDADGRLLASKPVNSAALGRDLTGDYAHLRSAVGGAPAVSGVVPSAIRGEPVVGFAVPFQTSTGRRVFSGAYAVEDTPIAPFVRNALPFRSGQVLVVDQAGRIVAGSGAGDIGRLLIDISPTLALVENPTAHVGSDETGRYVSQGLIEGTTWRLLFAVDTAELFAPLGAGAGWVPWAALLGFGILALLTLMVLSQYLEQRARLVESERRQREILNTAGDGFVGMGNDGMITDWNAAATRLLGWEESEALGRSLAELLVPPEDRAAYLATVNRFLTTGETSLPGAGMRVQAMRKDGGRADVEFSLSRLRWGRGWQFHAFLRDISEQLEHERQLQQLALTDDLTGLLNRRAVLERLDQALARAKRHDTAVAVLFIDVDEFKAVNDQYGHAAGDVVLTTIAARLRGLFRVEDSVARLGGDEFVVVWEDLHSQDTAQQLADRTRVALALPYEVDGHLLNVSASVGLAVATGGIAAELLLERADSQMYDAKAARQALLP